MPVTYDSKTTATTGSGPAVLSVPANTANTDLLIAAVNTGSGSSAFTPPAGWAALITPWTDGNDSAGGIWWRVASSEPASYTFSWTTASDYCASMMLFKGADPVSPIRSGARIDHAPGTGASFSTTALTGTQATDLTVQVGQMGDDNGVTTYTVTEPSSTWTSISNFLSTAKFQGAVWAPGAQSGATWTSSSAFAIWNVSTFAIVAATAAAPGYAPGVMSRPGLSRLRAHHGVSRQQQYQVFPPFPDATVDLSSSTLAITASAPAVSGLGNNFVPATVSVTTAGPAPTIADDNVSPATFAITTAEPADFTVTTLQTPPGMPLFEFRPGLSRLRAHHGASRQQVQATFGVPFVGNATVDLSSSVLAVTTAFPVPAIPDTIASPAALAVTVAAPADLAIPDDNVTVACLAVTTAYPFASVVPLPQSLSVAVAFPQASVVNDNVVAVAPIAVTTSCPAITLATDETASPAVRAVAIAFPQAVIADDNIRFLNPAIAVTTAIPLPQVGPPVSPVLEAFGFTPFPGIIPSSPIVAVTVNINQFASSALMGAPTFELWDGTASQIGTTQTGTATTSSANVDAATFTGPVSYTQLSTLRVRIRGSKGTAATGATETVNWVSLTVIYVELADTAQASGINSVTAYPSEIVTGGISATAVPAAMTITTSAPRVKALELDTTVLPAVLASAGAYPLAIVATGMIVSAVTLAILTAEPAPTPADNTAGPDYASGGDVTGTGQGTWVGVPTGPPGTSSAIWTVP